MFQKIALFITVLCIPLHTSFASEIEDIQKIIQEYPLSYQQYAALGSDIYIDISSLDTLLKENYPSKNFSYEWDVYGQSKQEGKNLKTSFQDAGEKTIQFAIYSQEDTVKALTYSSNISLFIYRESLPLLISSTIPNGDIEKFTKDAKDLGVYVKNIGVFSEKNIPGNTIIEDLKKYTLSFPEHSDYIVLWGEKEFLFSSLAQIHTALPKDETLNMVLVSGYNTSILRNYIGNNIAGKTFIGKAFIIDETLKFQILKNPKSIENLEKEVENNSYSYTPISNNISISPLLFASRFVNQLSNMGISTSDIYIILLLPLFLTFVGIAKHMIGISTLGSVIPLFMTLLYIKMGIPFTLGFFLFLLVFNILISGLISKYTLLYTPKVSFITILNFLAFMIFYNSLHYIGGIQIPIDNILYVALFFIVSEKLVTIITSKEFREYKKSVNGTIIVSLLCFILYSIHGLQAFLLAYPEVLLLFVPLNFFLGRFTGLRITEYLRFREIIKNIEE